MANTKTLLAIRTNIESTGQAWVPISTIEHYLGAPFVDDDDCETAVDALVAGVSWATYVEYDWINRALLFRGPQILTGSP